MVIIFFADYVLTYLPNNMEIKITYFAGYYMNAVNVTIFFSVMKYYYLIPHIKYN